MSDSKEQGHIHGGQEREVSPGERLRIAREESGLSVNEVASHLKLSVEKIKSLEQGKVDRLSAPVFVAGYLRAYAKLVDLPEEEIIADFKALSTMESPSMDPSTSPAANNYGQMESGAGRKGGLVKGKDWGPVAVWGSIAIVVAVILFMAVIGDEPESINKAERKTGKIDFPAIIENEKNEEINDNRRDIITENGIEPGQDQAVHTEVQNENDISVTDAPVPKNKNEQPVNDLKREKEPETTAESTTLDQENLKHSVVVFNFRNDSWVEVKDAHGKRLLYRMGKAGTSRTIWGVSPFKVQLGFVEGVEIIFNGEPYDMSRFANRRSVLFTLGKAGDRMTSN